MSSDVSNSFGLFLVNRFGDRYLYEVNHNAFNQIGAELLYQRHFADRLHQPDKLYLIIGCDSGLLLRYLTNQQIPNGSRYLVVELPEVLERLTQEGFLAGLPEQVALVTSDSVWERASELRFADYVYLGAVDFVEAICAMDAHWAAYRDLTCSIQEALRRSVWSITASMGQTQFIEKQLENLAENRHEAALLEGACEGKTAVLLAGGPSFDAIIPWVKANLDRVAVFAVSRISRQLLNHGIQPHLVFCVDPQDVSFDVSREMLQFGQDVLFVNAYHVTPLLLGQWPGRNVYFGPRFPWETPLNRPNLVGAGPTVTNAALDIAVSMGFSQVVFGGVDLCYSSSGMTHAQGSTESAAGPRLGDTLTVETNDGGQAETGSDYAAAIITMGKQVGRALGKGCKVINPMPKSARIPNVEYVSLDKIEIDPFEQPLASILTTRLPAETSEQRAEYYRKGMAELQRVATGLRTIGKLADDALECNKKLFGRKGGGTDFKYKVRMDKIEKRLDRDFGDLSRLVKRYGIRGFFKIVRPGGKETWSEEELEKAGRMYYQAYRESSAKLLALVERAQARMVSRLFEEAESPDFKALAEQWRKDRQPGRARVWVSQHPDLFGNLSPETAKCFSALERELAEQLAATEADLVHKLARSRSFIGVGSRAQNFFKSGDKQGLLRLLAGLAAHPEREGAELLEHLIAGYVAELSGRPDEALTHYEFLVGETFDPLTEPALKRILAVSLARQDRELSLSALECLADAALVYKPQYAELLRILGRPQDAADVYVDYLERVPEDTAAMLKLGQLYRGMGQADAARQVFGMVLEVDPFNRAAEALLKEF
ncbi:MAG: motility associated factor glycosyltransferase family protein [Trichloromonadaceae bacterium]